jgi:hypothetical protein
MSADERTRILQLVAAGTISPAEGSDLLAAVESPTLRSTAAVVQPAVSLTPRSRRYLVVRIMEHGEPKVNLRIPLSLARIASRFIPRQAHMYLNSHEIDIPQLLESLGTAEDDGTLLEVNDGADRVLIAIE